MEQQKEKITGRDCIGTQCSIPRAIATLGLGVALALAGCGEKNSRPDSQPAVSAAKPTNEPSTTAAPITTIEGGWMCDESNEKRPYVFFKDGTYILYSAQDAGNHVFVSGWYSLEDKRLIVVNGMGRVVRVADGQELLPWAVSNPRPQLAHTNFRVHTYNVLTLTPDRMERSRVEVSSGPGGETKNLQGRSDCVRSDQPALAAQREAIPAGLYAEMKNRLTTALNSTASGGTSQPGQSAPEPSPKEAAERQMTRVFIAADNTPRCGAQLRSSIERMSEQFAKGEDWEARGQGSTANMYFKMAAQQAEMAARIASNLGCM